MVKGVRVQLDLNPATARRMKIAAVTANLSLGAFLTVCFEHCMWAADTAPRMKASPIDYDSGYESISSHYGEERE